MEIQLPKNWVQTELEKVSFKVTDGTHKTPKYLEEGVRFISIKNIKAFKPVNFNSYERYISEIEHNALSKRAKVEKGDIVFPRIGTLGYAKIVDWDEETSIFVGLGLIKLVQQCINPKFAEYYLNSPVINKLSHEKATGSGRLTLSLEQSKKLPFLLPPLAEQHRIVAKLDSLFAHLENIKYSMVNIPLLIKDFRQQVLAQAVTGQLTEEWRKGKELGEWKNVRIENLINSLKTDIRTGPFGSALKKEEHKSEGIPVWGIESIGLNGKFTGSNKIYVTKEKALDLKSFEVKGGNIIISRSGTVGELCILPHDIVYGLISTNLMKIILNNDVISSKYFCWLFKGSPVVIEKLNDLCKGSTRLFLTQTILKNLVFPLPPLQEQQEIVSRVESLFAKADAIEQQYKDLKASIDNLPQALLHKAFKGELTEQLDNDGDARDLLNEIKALKAATVKVIKSKTNKIATKKVKPYSKTEEALGMVAETK